MSKLFTTGPVENAVSNSALSVVVKILNNSTKDTINAKITLYSLDGTKEQVSSVTLSLAPLSSDYTSYQVDFLKEYEIQIEVDGDETALVSVWGLDSEANLIAAQRFVHTELKEYSILSAKTNTLRMPSRKIRKRGR